MVSLSWLLCPGLALLASASPTPGRGPHWGGSPGRGPSGGGSPGRGPSGAQWRNVSDFEGLYTLPMFSRDPVARAKAIEYKRENFLYGPSIAGNVSYWPTGLLGNASIEADVEAFNSDSVWSNEAVEEDEAVIAKTLGAAGELKTLADYEALYTNQWKDSIPTGVDSGILSNYTNDLMFSMLRLSVNPYSLRRLNSKIDALSFSIEDGIVEKITGLSLKSLFESGRLFYVDHRNQAKLESTGRYAAHSEAYFYIHPRSGEFLPLAVKPNAGSDLIYTPLDSENDWLLAKIMFNLNDFWHSQWYHFAGTHFVVEIVYEAAIRTFSAEHPILALLKRLTLEVFAFRPIAIEVLIGPNGDVNKLFAFTGDAAGETVTEMYQSGTAGAFQSNYFHENLAKRGLIHSPIGPKLTHFPFYEDASIIWTAISTFMTTFIDSYYSHPDLYAHDHELQAFITESHPAQILDFPSTATRETLIALLTHIAFLSSAAHHTLNTNEISQASGVLPFTPLSLYQPVPTKKGIQDIVPFLPNATQSIGQIALMALFARPEYAGSNRTLSHMFDDKDLLARLNPRTEGAAAAFKRELSGWGDEVVKARRFDERGLSQGMPFLWKALDPNVAPYYLTI